MFEGLSRLLAVNGYMPHGFCINWSPLLISIFVVSDVLIFLAYFSMPVALIYFARRRPDFPYRWLLWLSAAFIMACGTTHLMDALVIWWPLYRLDALLKIITALVSVTTAVMIWPLIPHALEVPSALQLQRANDELHSEIALRRRAEEALRLAKEAAEDSLQDERIRMAAIVECSEDAIISKDLDGMVTSWNHAAEKIFGFTAAQMLGKSIVATIPPELRDEEAALLAAIGRGQSVEHFETERWRQDGSRFAVSITLSPILDKARRVVGASKILRDISAQKLAEARIQELNANLEQKVSERTAELTAANLELESFAYAVSHDLRAPLRAMSGFSQALLEDYGDLLPDEAMDYLKHIDRASHTMGELIDGILVLSRSTRGVLHRQLIDVSALATRLCQELERGESGRGLVWQVEAGLHASGDQRMIEAVLRNLLGNAWKYTGKAAAPEIRVYSVAMGGRRGICVADNGAGFDMAHAERLFQPFQRLHRQDEFPGLGIGLATVQRIVRRHGGEIRAEASPGEGARFCFTLPEGTAEDWS